MTAKGDATPGGTGEARRILGVPRWMVRIGLASWLIIGAMLLITALVAGIAATRAIVMPVLFAAIVAILANPLVDNIERRGRSRPLGAFLAVFVALAITGGVVWLVGAGITSQASEIADQFDEASQRIRSIIDDLSLDPDLVARVREAFEDAGPTFGNGIASSVVSGVSSVATFMFGTIIGLVIFFYLLRDAGTFTGWVQQQIPERFRPEAAALGQHSADTVRRYFAGRSVVSLVDAIVIAGAAAILGVPLVGPIAILTFFGGYIPYLGAFLSGAFAVLLALASGGWVGALILLAVVLVTQNVIEPLVEARVIGSSLGLHPVVVLIVTTLGGVVAGIPGLIIAAPLTSIVIAMVGGLRRMGFFS